VRILVVKLPTHFLICSIDHTPESSFQSPLCARIIAMLNPFHVFLECKVQAALLLFICYFKHDFLRVL